MGYEHEPVRTDVPSELDELKQRKIDPLDQWRTRLEQRQHQLEEAMKKLEERGIDFGAISDTMPEEICLTTPHAMRYVTPKALIDSGLTRYTHNRILDLIRQKAIPGYYIAGNAILDALGVQKLLERETDRLAAPVLAGGKPGARRRQPGSPRST